LAVLGHPGTDAKFGIAVSCGGINVINAVLQQELKRAIRLRLVYFAERSSAKQRPRAQMSGAAKRKLWDHRSRSSSIPTIASIFREPHSVLVNPG
jgi:hypothetical protein